MVIPSVQILSTYPPNADHGNSYHSLPTFGDSDAETLTARVLAQRPRGVFSVHYGNGLLFRSLEARGIPVVLIMIGSFLDRFYTVCVDDFQGTNEGALRLIWPCAHPAPHNAARSPPCIPPSAAPARDPDSRTLPTVLGRCFQRRAAHSPAVLLGPPVKLNSGLARNKERPTSWPMPHRHSTMPASSLPVRAAHGNSIEHTELGVKHHVGCSSHAGRSNRVDQFTSYPTLRWEITRSFSTPLWLATYFPHFTKVISRQGSGRFP